MFPSGKKNPRRGNEGMVGVFHRRRPSCFDSWFLISWLLGRKARWSGSPGGCGKAPRGLTHFDCCCVLSSLWASRIQVASGEREPTESRLPCQHCNSPSWISQLHGDLKNPTSVVFWRESSLHAHSLPFAWSSVLLAGLSKLYGVTYSVIVLKWENTWNQNFIELLWCVDGRTLKRLVI